MAYFSEGSPVGRARGGRSERISTESDESADDASLRSNARTSMERWSERSSNDTIASFLDDHDVHASADFTHFVQAAHLPATEWATRAADARLDLKRELKGDDAPSARLVDGKAVAGKAALGKAALGKAALGGSSSGVVPGAKHEPTHAPPALRSTEA